MIWTITTTHSPTVIKNIPRDHIAISARAGSRLHVPQCSKLDIAILLGGGVAYRGAILVEDETAQQFLEAIIDKPDPELLRQFEVVVAGSESNITAILKTMPQTRNWLSLFGAYDGDMRLTLGPLNLSWPYGLCQEIPLPRFSWQVLKVMI